MQIPEFSSKHSRPKAIGYDVPGIVCLCGSTKFKDEFLQAQAEWTREGWIVLSVGFFTHADGLEPTEEEKAEWDKLHLSKIDLADIVYVINVGGYIGHSTRNEINYAYKTLTPIMWWEE